MKLLLDSHSFLWASHQPRRLGPGARKAIASKRNDVLVSSVSFWEIALKLSLGKLELQGIAPADLPRIASEHDFTVCALTADTAASFNLPRIRDHRDPFDRMLVWQALRESAVLISRDRAMAPYEPFGLQLLW